MAASATFTVDTSVAAPTFSPAGTVTTVTDASGNITLTFAEALRKDASGTALENGDLGRPADAGRGQLDGGTAIGFAATIDAAKKVITIDPSADLAEGTVFVAITNGYFDAHGNQGAWRRRRRSRWTRAWRRRCSAPADGTTVTDASGDITLSFGEALRKDASGAALENSDLAGLLTLKTDDSRRARRSASRRRSTRRRPVITIDPSADLAEGPVYVAISERLLRRARQPWRGGVGDVHGGHERGGAGVQSGQWDGDDADRRVGGHHAQLRRGAAQGRLGRGA